MGVLEGVGLRRAQLRCIRRPYQQHQRVLIEPHGVSVGTKTKQRQPRHEDEAGRNADGHQTTRTSAAGKARAALGGSVVEAKAARGRAPSTGGDNVPRDATVHRSIRVPMPAQKTWALLPMSATDHAPTVAPSVSHGE